MLTANITLPEFFEVFSYRSQFLSELGLKDSSLSFEELRIETAKKLFGSDFVESKEFKISYLEDQERIYLKCLGRDKLNLVSQKRQKMYSLLSDSIKGDELKLKRIRIELLKLKS